MGISDLKQENQPLSMDTCELIYAAEPLEHMETHPESEDDMLSRSTAILQFPRKPSVQTSGS
jgi:hypothetical protein